MRGFNMEVLGRLSSLYKSKITKSLVFNPLTCRYYSSLALPKRFFSLSHGRNLKEIHVKTEGNQTVVEAIHVESERKGKVLEMENPQGLCPICPFKLNMEIHYTDVLILSQFLRPDGCLLPRRVTGLCNKAHTRMRKLVHQAQRAGLMPEFRPDRPPGKERKSETQRSGYKWKKYNAFYPDDSVHG